MAPAFLAAFCGSTVAAISIMGGVFAVLPAYEADLYGPKYVQAIHGRFLLAATVSTIAGPLLLLNLRKAAEASAPSFACSTMRRPNFGGWLPRTSVETSNLSCFCTDWEEVARPP